MLVGWPRSSCNLCAAGSGSRAMGLPCELAGLQVGLPSRVVLVCVVGPLEFCMLSGMGLEDQRKGRGLAHSLQASSPLSVSTP